MHAQPFYAIGHFLGGRIPFGRKTCTQIVTFLRGTKKFTETVMILDQTSTSVTRIENLPTTRVICEAAISVPSAAQLLTHC